MANVNCTVYFRENGTSKMYSVGQAKGRLGSYGIRWYEGKRQRQKIIGQYSAATAAKLRKELELRKAASPKANSAVLGEGSATLDEAIQTFVGEREDLNPTSARRWKIELDLFKQQVGKTHLYQLTRDDVFTYRKWYKEHGRSDNTIALRTSSLFTFGLRFNVLFNLFTKNERKRLTLRTDGPVDYYTENDTYELKKFFAACDNEERLNDRQLSTKVVIKQRTLRGSAHTEHLQTVALVYIDGDEYRVLAPPGAVGDSLEWLDHLSVRQPDPNSFGGELEAASSYGTFAVKLVKEELEKLRGGVNTQSGLSAAEIYYHVRVHISHAANIGVKFDLRPLDLEERILKPYRNLRPIVIGGRTIALQEIQRIEIFESTRPSSQFGEWAVELARQGTRDWFHGESDVKDVTDEFINTPAVPVLPQKTDAVELLCHRFHTMAVQLRARREGRPTLDVTDEYDVQDLLHALLRIFFDDVRPEEVTPSYAAKSSRMDFLLPTEQVVIEAKKTRPGLDAKELGSQLIEDIARYRTHPSCKRLICFVYDPDGRVTNPRGIERDLSRTEDDFEVTVIIVPGA